MFRRPLWIAIACGWSILVVATASGQSSNPQESTAGESELKPVVVAAVSSLGQLFADAKYVGNLVTAGRATAPIALARGWLNGIDMQRSLGVLFFVDESGPKGIGCVPVKRFDALRSKIEQRLGPAENTGRKIFRLRVVGDVEVYFRESDDWVFVAEARRHLLKIPQNPERFFQPLIEQETVAIRFDFQALPESTRDTISQELNGLVEQATELLGTDSTADDAAGRLRVELQQQQLKSLTQLLEDAEAVTVGIRADREAHRMIARLDLDFTADSQWAAQRKHGNPESEIDILQLRHPDAAVTFFARHRLQGSEQASWKTASALFRRQLADAFSRDSKDALGKQIKELSERLLDEVDRTVGDQTFVISGTLWLQKQIARFGLAVRVSDGRAIEKILNDLIKTAKENPDFPKVELNVEKHGEVSMHTASIPLPESEQEARLVFGPELTVTFGFGPKTVFLILGDDGVNWLKRQLADRAPSQLKEGTVMDVVVSLMPLLTNLPDVDPEKRQQIRRMAQALKDDEGHDQIHVVVSEADLSVQYRLDVSDGVFKLLGTWLQGMDEDR